MPDRVVTEAVAVEPDLVPGAYNAIHVCLRLKADERITIITDEETLPIAAALEAQVEELGADYGVFVLENYAARPIVDMPQPILDHLGHSDVSIFCAQAQRGELRSRMQMSDVVNRHRLRHAHMVNITRQIMLEGMRADFLE